MPTSICTLLRQNRPKLLRSDVVRTLSVVLFAALFQTNVHAQNASQSGGQPALPADLIQQANDAVAASDFPAALKVLTILNAQSPNNPQILYDLGLTLEALQAEVMAPKDAAPTAFASSPATAPTAESCYREAIASDPNFPAPHVALGLLLARIPNPASSQLAEARAELLAATTLPDADTALKARAFRALSRLDQLSVPPNPTAASIELLAALKLTPENPDDILLSAQIAKQAGDLAAAEQAYRRYLASNPADTQAIADLAHILLTERHPADAETLLIPALTASPNNPGFTAQLAEAYLASGEPARIARAVPLVEALHASLPANANITRMLARVYLETGRPDQADPLYSSLLAAPSDHPDPTLLDDRAEVLLRLHRPAEAEKLLKLAVANPTSFPTPQAFADAATHLAFAAAEIDDPRITLQALALRATVQPSLPSSLFLEATANDDLHQSSKAAELYQKFLAAAHGTLPEQESQARARLAVTPARKVAFQVAREIQHASMRSKHFRQEAK